MIDRPMTPVLSDHARQRAAEMHVNTKRIKRLLRAPDIVRTSYMNRYLAVSDADPEIAVVYAVDAEGQYTVVTVLYRSLENWTRSA